MAFDQRTLELNFAQLKRAIYGSADNAYSDGRKRDYHDKLIKLVELVEADLSQQLSQADQIQVKTTIDFVFKSLEFLDHSILTMIPFELVFCLEQAMEKWIPNSREQFIIVTSFGNEIHTYYFDPTLANSDLYDIVNSRYNILFGHRLVQINLPKYLATDYLANVILYHELGHFIDHYYQISERVHQQIIFDLQSGNNVMVDGLLSQWFRWTSILLTRPNDQVFQVLYYHLAEYFADNFACLFISSRCSDYLEYIAPNSDDSNTHPATAKRSLFVNEWVMGRFSDLHRTFSATTIVLGLPGMVNLSKPLRAPGFLKLIPTRIEEVDQLHSLFQEGWKVWHGDRDDFRTENGMANIPSAESTYAIINNLIEKSISNFIVKQKWGLLNGAGKS